MFTMGLKCWGDSVSPERLMASKGRPVASTPMHRRTPAIPLSMRARRRITGLMMLWMVKGTSQSPAERWLPSGRRRSTPKREGSCFFSSGI